MDITSNALKTMKVKQLRRIIRESVMEVLNEDPEKAKNLTLKANQLRQQAINIDKQATAEKEKDLKQDTQATVAEGEIELNEFSRPAEKYKVTDPNINTAPFTKEVGNGTLADVINFIKNSPDGVQKKEIQTQFGLPRPQQADALISVLFKTGIVSRVGLGGELEGAPEARGEEPIKVPVQATEPEDLFMGSAENPLSMYFDNVPNDDGDEDFNDEEEPTVGELEPATPTAGSMSDADYEAFMKYDDLKNRLDATKSNILKAKRSKGGTSGDIGDKPGTELARLNDLKKSLETRIDTIVKTSPYLQKRIEKLTGKAYEPIEVEPEEEDTLDETYNAEYEKRKLQFYAGIIK